MTNKFTIVISATDKATATVKKVNDAMGRLARPFQEVGKSFKGLGRELGLPKIGKQLGAVGQTAGSAARGVASIVAPLAALTGAASIGGVIAFATSWGRVGREVTYAAQNIGISTSQLQSYEGAAKLAGLANGAMTSSLDTLGTTMQDALYGRNQQALMLFNRLGVGIKRTKDGAVDAAGEFKALSRVIYGMKNPQQQSLVAGQLGLTAVLPLIRQGPAAMDRLMASAKALGLVMDGPALKAANDYALSLEKIEASGEGLRNSIGNALIPAIQPLVEQLSGWISANRALISAKVGQWARDFGKWVSSVDWNKVGNGVSAFFTDIGKVVDALGGWKNTAIAVGVVMNAGLIASLVRLGLVIEGTTLVLVSKLVGKMWALSTASKAATAANGAAVASSGAATAAGLSLVTKANVVAATLALSGDTGTAGRNAQQLLAAAKGGDKGAALALARTQLTHWWSGAPANEAINARARQLMAGGIGGDESAYRPKLMGAMQSLQKMGWTSAQAAGIAANLGTESGFNPAAVGDGGSAYGIGQWHEDRQKAFEKWAGHSMRGSSLDEQLKFVNYELTQGNERAAGDRLRGTRTASDAAGVVSQYYERPADTAGEMARRGALAERVAPAGPYSGGSSDVSGKVHVEVELKNAPPGTQVKATPTGNTTAATRIGYSGIGQVA